MYICFLYLVLYSIILRNSISSRLSANSLGFYFIDALEFSKLTTISHTQKDNSTFSFITFIYLVSNLVLYYTV